VGSGHGLAGGAGGVGFGLEAEGVEAGLQDIAEGLLDEVAGDEGGGIDGAFLLAAAAGFDRIRRGQFPLTPALSPEERETRRSSFREWGPPLPVPLPRGGEEGAR